MKRSELITQLEQVQGNIEIVERQLNTPMGAYYSTFGRRNEWAHLQEIRTKALAYWKRRFNRILLTLGYDL